MGVLLIETFYCLRLYGISCNVCSPFLDQNNLINFKSKTATPANLAQILVENACNLLSSSPIIHWFLILDMKTSSILIQIPMLGVWWDMLVSHWPKDFWKNSYVWPVWNLQVCTKIEKSRNFGFVICLVNVSCSSYVNNKPWILDLPILLCVIFCF